MTEQRTTTVQLRTTINVSCDVGCGARKSGEFKREVASVYDAVESDPYPPEDEVRAWQRRELDDAGWLATADRRHLCREHNPLYREPVCVCAAPDLRCGIHE